LLINIAMFLMVYFAGKGHLLAFPGNILHGGDPVVSGTRYIIAVFLMLADNVPPSILLPTCSRHCRLDADRSEVPPETTPWQPYDDNADAGFLQKLSSFVWKESGRDKTRGPGTSNDQIAQLFRDRRRENRQLNLDGSGDNPGMPLPLNDDVAVEVADGAAPEISTDGSDGGFSFGFVF
jgi:hypothetical protein